jgi:polyisoprenoid-binding protein YceI
MRKISLFVLALTLAACQSTTPTTDTEAPTPPDTMPVEEKAPVAEVSAFTGTHSDINEAGSTVAFTGKSSLIDHPGEFKKFDAVLTLDATEPADLEKASLKITLDVASMKTDSAAVDGHLQKADFFDAANNPQVVFQSTKIESKGDNMYAITGDMTAKGQTKSMTIEAKITDDSISSSFTFPRKDYGIGNDSYGDKLLAEDMPVSVEFVFAK